jgi:hypothetical protein
MNYLTITTLITLLCACHAPAQTPDQGTTPTQESNVNPYPSIGAIPVPAGYHRIAAEQHSFTAWLRTIGLKKDKTVYLFDGSPKRNQDAQFAVLDISVGHQDLQHCADAVMRLRAEYLYANHDFFGIDFYTEQGVRLNFVEWANGLRVRQRSSELERYTLAGDHHFCEDRACFDTYLNTVFTYCGTRTLERALTLIPLSNISPGDVLIHGGSPGHAMLVVDVAENAKGDRIFLLAQSYMPAQDIHIVKNPNDPNLTPWYPADPYQTEVATPEWTFKTNELRTWPPIHRQL